MKKYTIGVVGMGGMGFRFLNSFIESDRWEVGYVCDLNEARLEKARDLIPTAMFTKNLDDLLNDPAVDAVAICTLADIRPKLLTEALNAKKHVIAEKPLADSIAGEWELLKTIEASGLMVAVDIFNRNAWYHDEIQAFIASGEIGELAIVSVDHQTPGLMPTEGHSPEGPPFHDCGMHYVDVARWYAGSEYKEWHAQGMRMWDWEDPWWLSAHGQFENGVVFNITQGFVYGQMAKDRTVRCGIEVIGTKGLVRMKHDMKTVTIEYHGVNTTKIKQGDYGSKKTDVMCERFAEALDTGDDSRLPSARDSVIASSVSQEMLDFAKAHAAPAIGTRDEMESILEHRKQLKA
ncbi:Gfo/Idh/MocA family oxidoreductase [Coraliomargarita sp. SDUM461004]|uniref:Gfo/Idh/MocA family oxidoreductase n=1 Tax=Thalassobacterium sedimentorum TaxID=3041258 RepID=A0ABU1AGB3_9BACT|nr:Gfo/Idh/MocA family oxidoreductase [Coraliomargarita sp. SDUM461004]MDQ8192801.1 Gfo/Idh/MocA family oxidoreductase [Coraliomargarita sp. SDUM461004]